MKKVIFSLPVSIFKEDSQFITLTPSLDISTCGESIQEAENNFTELVRLFFEEIDRKGTTDQVLSSLGWAKLDKQWSPPVEIEHRVK